MTERRSSILRGDWEQYRCLQRDKKRCRGWWGTLLQDKSARQLTEEVTDHLTAKMVDNTGVNWDAELANIIRGGDLGQRVRALHLP